MEKQNISVGRIVRYTLSEADAEAINRRRVTTAGHSVGWPAGAQAHVGNPASPGEVYPLIVCHVWPDEFGPGIPGVNGQVFLDGNNQQWVCSAREGIGAGTWAWPERT